MLDPRRLFRIDLSAASPVAQGKEKIVYQHPDVPALLVKVHNPALQLAPHRLLHRAGRYKAFAYQLEEYVALRGRFPTETLPVETVYGLADTDRGLGLLVEKAGDEDGNLGPSLRQLVKQQGLTALVGEQVEAFADALLRFNVIASDLNPSNIVLGHWQSRGRLVLVDGFGDKNLVPLRSLSRRINRRKNLRQVQELRDMLEEIASRPRPPVAVEAGPSASGR